MTIVLWTIVGVLVSAAIWWIMDWHDKFPDGE